MAIADGLSRHRRCRRLAVSLAFIVNPSLAGGEMSIDANWAGLLMLFALIVGLSVGWAWGFIRGTRAIAALANEQDK
jgi:hypothetical protein